MLGYVLKYEDLTAKKNKTYYYKVRSLITINDKRVYSSYSDVKSLTCYYTKPAVQEEPETSQTPENP